MGDGDLDGTAETAMLAQHAPVNAMGLISEDWAIEGEPLDGDSDSDYESVASSQS